MTGATVLDRYLAGLAATIAALDREAILAAAELLAATRAERRTVFVFGNGGSATTAAHIGCDLGKNTRGAGQPGVRMVCLAVDAGTLSAYANDEGYDAVFSEPLRTLAEPGDVALAVSAGGTSSNVVRALEVAREIGLTTIGLTGPDGGKVPALVDVCVHVGSDRIEQIEDGHVVINHLLTVLLRGDGDI